MVLDILTATGTVGAVIIGMTAIYYSNKNSKKEIITEKLEEIYQLVHSLNRYYGLYEALYSCILDLRDSQKKDIKTLADYYKLRDEKIPLNERLKITAKLSRLEVLTKCYTEGSLLTDLLKYEDLMYSYSELIFVGGSFQQEIKWKKGFPKPQEMFDLISELQTKIVAQIKQK